MNDDFNLIRKINLENEKGHPKPEKLEIPMIKPTKKRFLSKTLFTSKKTKILGSLLLVFLIFVIVGIVTIVLPAVEVYKDAKKLLTNIDEIKVLLASPDIVKMKEESKKIRDDLIELRESTKRFSWTRGLPFIKNYYSDVEAALNAGFYGLDAGDVAITTIEPYADIIGFVPDGNEAKSGEETANDRIDFIVQTIGQIIPKLDEISNKVTKVQEEVDKIDSSRYPESFKGIPVRAKIQEFINLVDEGAAMLANGKPLLQKVPYLIGIDESRTYLVLFQNDKELRPTGGFLTAYSIMTVDKGKMRPVSSNDIYNLDSKYSPSVPAPDPLIKYLKGPYILSKNYRLRDMNFAPDFTESMDLFTKEAQKAGVKDIDGVITVDTEVVVKILEVIGKIGVPGFGNFSTEIVPECNCPQVIYELESFADIEGPVVWSQDDPDKIIFAPANYDNRKKIVGPLMNSVIANALGQPKEKVPDLVRVAWDLVTQKHVLIYLFDKEAQNAAEAFNIAGKIVDFDGDYLHINDANLGGRKSNLYVTQEVYQEIEIAKDGSIEKTLEITYKNPQSYDGWLNSVLPNWTRVYVPKGSELVSVSGFEDQGKPYEEYGKAVFSGGFKLRPEGVAKISIKYKLPFKVDKEYKLLIQKQPGTGSPLYTFKLGKKEDEFFLLTDKFMKLKI